jgi:hypothetical protein
VEEPMELHLDTTQVDLLREILDSAFRNLRFEIADTDNSVYKHNLKEREQSLKSILEKVGGPLPDRP